MIFASDLDNTLIFSKTRKTHDSTCVEKNQGKETTYMTKESIKLLKELSNKLNFIPVTSRSVEQYKRIKFREIGINIEYALTTNGAILLVNGEIDKEWYNEVQNELENLQSKMTEIIEFINSNYEEKLSSKARKVDGCYVFTKVHGKEIIKEIVESIKEICTDDFSIDVQNLKIYLMPKVISKETALLKIKRKLNPKLVISAGDSELDMGMVSQAEIGYIPKYSENKMKRSDQNLIVIDDETANFGYKILNDINKRLLENKPN